MKHALIFRAFVTIKTSFDQLKNFRSRVIALKKILFRALVSGQRLRKC